MPIPPELNDFYALSARPYVECEGPIPASVLGLRSWRYLIEINSACNLRCAMCITGNRTGYEYEPGIMAMPMLEQVLDKIKSENPNAIICPYGSGEPFLNPQLPECIAAIKRRGFRCELATNLHFTNRLDDVLLAQPDFLIVSTSGFTQPIYSRAHRGGNVETLKANLLLLKEAVDRLQHKGAVAVSYHMYLYNLGEEMAQMEQLVNGLGFMFMRSWARVISMENTVQALRLLEKQKTGEVREYGTGKDGQDWNKLLPPANPDFLEAMHRLRFHPAKAIELYARFPVSPLCLIGDVFTYIRHDGRVQLCACTDDLRMTLGNYLDMSQDQISAARRDHPFCRECLRYRMNLYYHVVDCTKWDTMTPLDS